MESTFARDMRAVRRDRGRHWRGQVHAALPEGLEATYRAAVVRYRAAPCSSTCDEVRRQDWEYAITAAVDERAANQGDLAVDAAAVLRKRDIPAEGKTERRLVRRLGLDWAAAR